MIFAGVANARSVADATFVYYMFSALPVILNPFKPHQIHLILK